MELLDLFDEDWKSHEEKRFLNDDTKSETDSFDPEAFQHEGFEHREKYFEEFVPALAAEKRLEAELNDFVPPRLGSINGSPYQALVIRYGVLRNLIQKIDYTETKETLLSEVQSWQQALVDRFSADDFPEDDDLLHLAKACIGYKGDVDDSELHLVYSYFELHNRAESRKHDYYTWLDFFQRLAAIDRFPKVSRTEKQAHALKTIEKGVWSLQEQAIVFEVSRGGEDLVGIPEDYESFVRDWLYYEMSDENFHNMLETLDIFDSQQILVEARDLFGVESGTEGLNAKRRESLVEAGVYPSELLREVVPKDELKSIVDQFGLDAHKRRTDEMIQSIIEYFEHSQKYGTDEPFVDLYLQCFDDISDGNVERIPPQLQELVADESDPSKRMDILFEEATAEIFREGFDLEGTKQLGQTSSGSVADGEIDQDGQWLLWDNKRRTGEFKLTASTRSKIQTYIETKDKQHDVEWFLLIAPEFAESAAKEAEQMEAFVGGIDIRLVRAADFRRLAEYWLDEFARANRELPLTVFHGAGEFDLELAKDTLKKEFS